MKSQWSKISLIFLFLVALIGTLLRSAAFIPIPLEYANLVHAHSHVAFQGWVYTLLFLLLIKFFLKDDQIKKGRYPLQFKLTIFVVIGVLISFSLQGYALYSIVFSTIFQLLNYWFIYRFLKDVKTINPPSPHSISLRFVITGLWLGVLSTLLPFGIGILSAKGLSETEAYQSLVYTFLHLQYNGWFLFVVLGLFFKFLENNMTSLTTGYAVKFYWLMTIAVIPAIALSLLGMEFSRYLLLPVIASAILLAAAFLFFIRMLVPKLIAFLNQKSSWLKVYLLAFLLSFSMKMILQCLSAFPIFKSLAFYNKSIIIAYLHLTLIGSISFLLLALMLEMKWLAVNRAVKLGSLLFISGFTLTEFLLVLSGIGLFHNQIALILGSLAMVLGILLLIISRNSEIN